MPSSLADNPAVADADLVIAALDGDRQAFAAIYDAYADRVHTMCVHMLGDRDEAADVCGEVFLVAFQRLAQLREPARLRPWLFAICRHEVYRRTKRRRRVELVEEVNEMDRIAAAAWDGNADDHNDSFDQVAMAQLVQQAATGLDERDRLVLELQLQGLEGDDLAAALGTSTSTSYQHVHRMRERMERSLGALLVARQGRKDCTELAALLREWDGQYSVLWRKRIARHVDGCDTCEHRRRAVPAAIFGAAGASPLVVTPTSVRERVLAEAKVGTGGVLGRRGWRADGFPPGHEPRRRRFAGLLVGLVLLAIAAVAVPTLLDGDEEVDVAGISVIASTSTTETSATSTSTTVVASPTSVGSPSTTVLVVASTTQPSGTTAPALTTTPTRPTTTVPKTTTTVPKTTTTAPRTTTTAPRTTTTTATTTTIASVPPSLRLGGPTNLYARALDGGECANQSFTARITAGAPTAVTLRWTVGRATGTAAMTRTKVPGTWTATLHLPTGTQGTATTVAIATNTAGGSGTSNPVTSIAEPCIIIG